MHTFGYFWGLQSWNWSLHDSRVHIVMVSHRCGYVRCHITIVHDLYLLQTYGYISQISWIYIKLWTCSAQNYSTSYPIEQNRSYKYLRNLDVNTTVSICCFIGRMCKSYFSVYHNQIIYHIDQILKFPWNLFFYQNSSLVCIFPAFAVMHHLRPDLESQASRASSALDGSAVTLNVLKIQEKLDELS